MSRVRNSYELELMRKSGNISRQALKKALKSVRAGVSELEIDEIARREIYRLGGDLSYKSIPNYKFATCITVNDQVVHGVPTDRKFDSGDLVGVDLAVSYKGWHTDCAWSILVEDARLASRAERGSLLTSRSEKIEDRKDKEKFLKIGQEALRDGVAQALDGNRVGDISEAIQNKVESAGYSVVRSLVGHGVGRSLHEEPEIPGYGKKGQGILLRSGMTLAIEVIYTAGSYEVALEKDGWTYSTVDNSWGGLFEMTVIVDKDKAEVLTDWSNRFVI